MRRGTSSRINRRSSTRSALRRLRSSPGCTSSSIGYACADSLAQAGRYIRISICAARTSPRRTSSPLPHSGQKRPACPTWTTNSPHTRHSRLTPRISAISSWSSVRLSGITSISERPEDSDHAAEYLDVLGVDGLERVVLGLEPDASVLAVEGLDGRLVRGLVVTRERDHDLAVAGRLLPRDDLEVAGEQPGMDHRVALDAQEELLAPARERLGDGDVLLDLLVGEQRAAGGDLAVERQPALLALARRLCAWALAANELEGAWL